MAGSSLLFLLSALCALATRPAAAQDDDTYKSVQLRTHSLHQPYLETDFTSRWFDYGGSTVIRTDGYIRLTGQHPSSAGWIFSKNPLTATNWEIEVEFQITGTGTLFGDGMAMWVTKQRAEPGPVFGMRDQFEGLGIFFDTYKNNRPGVVFPFVMAMLGDDRTSYDQGNDGKANELAGCSARGLRNPDFNTRAKITYYQDKSLTVDLMYKKEDEWTRCFEIPNIKLPAVSYLGFSAETGELSDNHDIISVTTKNIYQPGNRGGANAAGSNAGNRRKNREQRQQSSGGGWTWFIFKFLLFGSLLAVAYVGFTAYRARQRDRF